MLSVRSCRASRRRVAPTEIRTAISLALPADRASSRLATLVQAISKTSPTAPDSSSNRVRKLRLTSHSSKSSTWMVQPLLLDGYASPSCDAKADISVIA